MSVLNTILNRRSIRRYKFQNIPSDDLLKVLEAARQAQSAANRQPWEFIIISDSLKKNKLVDEASNQKFIANADIVIICLANPEESVKVGSFDSFLLDMGIAIENMVLTAWEMGIGSCWIGAFNEVKVKELFKIPEKLRVVSILTLGYPNEKENVIEKKRKNLKDIIYYDVYGCQE